MFIYLRKKNIWIGHFVKKHDLQNSGHRLCSSKKSIQAGGSLQNWPNFKLVFKGTLSKYTAEQVWNCYIWKVPLPPLQTYSPHTNIHATTWLTRGPGSVLFLLPLSSPRTSWSSPSLTHGRVLVNCNGCLLHYFLWLFRYRPRFKSRILGPSETWLLKFFKSTSLFTWQVSSLKKKETNMCVGFVKNVTTFLMISQISVQLLKKGTADLSRFYWKRLLNI